jgi:peptidoglycan/xylan/chitin deacetylase (PgdA/CDA1 family)
LSLDLDNKWSYLKTHGDDDWLGFPGYLDTVVPRVLSILSEHGIRLTVFIVGKDASDPANLESLTSIVAAGHEIGNHSFLHEPWLHLYRPDELRADLEQAHEAIAGATGVEPRGFRGPGFSLSEQTLTELLKLGYDYDATVFANVLNPIGRYYYFMRSNLSREDRKQRGALFGTLRDATRPNVPFHWALAGGELLELPVTTMPGLRIPFHFSYLIYLARFSERLALGYLRLGLSLCRARGVAPSLLLHPLDFLGVEDQPDLGFFPGMDLPRARKLELTKRFLDVVSTAYDIVPLSEYAKGIQPERKQPAGLLGR